MAVRLDDQFPIHRKVGALSDAAFRLCVEAMCWSRRHLTDGVILRDELSTVTRKSRPERYAAELVARGLWRELPDGWQIHDYLDWQQSRSKVLETREARKVAGHNGGVRSGQARAAAKTAGRSPPEAKSKQVAKRPLQTVRTPSPSPPLKGGSVGAREAPASPRSALSPESPHRFVEGGSGFCRCGLPRINKIHGGKR